MYKVVGLQGTSYFDRRRTDPSRALFYGLVTTNS